MAQNEMRKRHCVKISNLFALHIQGGIENDARKKKGFEQYGQFIVIILLEMKPSISAVDSIESTLNWKEFNKNISFSKSFYSSPWRSFAFAVPFGVDCRAKECANKDGGIFNIIFRSDSYGLKRVNKSMIAMLRQNK